MATLTATISAGFTAIAKGDATIVAQVHSPAFAQTLQFATGTLANQADLYYTNELTIAASAFTDLDLTGSLTNAVQVAFNAVKICGIVVVSDAANTSDITIGAAAANAFVGPFGAATHTIKIPPGGMFAVGTGVLAGLGNVTPGTADLLRIANGVGASAKVRVGIIGRSA